MANDLQILRKLKGFLFEDLDPAIQRKFLNTNVRVVFLEEGTTENVRQEIFKRINTSGSPIKPAEARRGSFEGKFKVFLEECVKTIYLMNWHQELRLQKIDMKALN